MVKGNLFTLLGLLLNCLFADEPEAPEKPQVMDWDEDHVDLAWVKPKSDGGSPIIEYIVQKKEKGSPYWANALTVPASQTAVSFLSSLCTITHKNKILYLICYFHKYSLLISSKNVHLTFTKYLLKNNIYIKHVHNFH